MREAIMALLLFEGRVEVEACARWIGEACWCAGAGRVMVVMGAGGFVVALFFHVDGLAFGERLAFGEGEFEACGCWVHGGTCSGAGGGGIVVIASPSGQVVAWLFGGNGPAFSETLGGSGVGEC